LSFGGKVPGKGLKGNPVKIRNCPRNCECGRPGHIHCIGKVGGACHRLPMREGTRPDDA